MVGTIYFYFDPSSEGTMFPRCPSLMLTGWQCPGCGSQRAIHSLLHLQIAQAWRFNPIVVFFIPYALILFIVSEAREKSPTCQRIWDILNSGLLAWIVVTLIVVFTIWRNIIQ